MDIPLTFRRSLGGAVARMERERNPGRAFPHFATLHAGYVLQLSERF